MSTRSARRAGWIALLVAVVAVVAWFVWSIVQAQQAARQFQSDTADVAAQAAALDTAALQQELPQLTRSAEQFQQSVQGPQWAVMSTLPLLGATAGSVQHLADAGVAGAAAAARLEPVLPQLEPDRIRTPEGRIDVRTLQDIAPVLDQMAGDLQTAESQVLQADPGAFGPVGAAVVSAQERLVGLPATVRTAAALSPVFAELLGAEGKRTWAVLLQNGSEARGTGGFLGAYALLRADNGKLTATQVDSNNSLTSRIPNGGMPKEFLELWSREYTSEWNSFNLSRHFPYTGELTQSGMAARGTPVTDVLAMDAHVVAGLLAGTGPVTADGVTVTSEDAVTFFNQGVYEQFPESAQKDAVVVALMQALMARVTTGSFDVAAAAQALAEPAAAGRVLVWSGDPRIQRELEPHAVAGVVPDEPAPWTTVALNNSAANKLDAFVASEVEYRADTCGGGPSTLTLRLSNNTPADGADYALGAPVPGFPRGTTSMWVGVYGPKGATVLSGTIDGKRQYVTEGRERGHPVWLYDMVIEPGQTSTLTVTFDEPQSAGMPQVAAQPMVIPQRTSVTSPCTGG